MDLAAAVDVTLLTNNPQTISTNVRGPIIINGRAMGALLLGRSSASQCGLFVLPGVIDADYEGEIYIMAYTLNPPVKIAQGQRIAQLVPLPQVTQTIRPVTEESRGNKGFGSTGSLTLLTLNLSTRPRKTVHLSFQGNTITVEGLLDTGADSSVLSPSSWPQGWPLQEHTTTITGVGGLTLANRTPPLQLTIEGQTVTAVLAVVQLPPGVNCLIGRDVLAQMGIVLTNDHHLF